MQWKIGWFARDRGFLNLRLEILNDSGDWFETTQVNLPESSDQEQIRIACQQAAEVAYQEGTTRRNLESVLSSITGTVGI